MTSRVRIVDGARRRAWSKQRYSLKSLLSLDRMRTATDAVSSLATSPAAQYSHTGTGIMLWNRGWLMGCSLDQGDRLATGTKVLPIGSGVKYLLDIA